MCETCMIVKDIVFLYQHMRSGVNLKYYGERLKEESWKGTGLKKAADF